MAARVYHWRHGWIPLDHVAASEKHGGTKPVAAAHLRRDAHIDAVYNGDSGAFGIRDRKTGHSAHLSTDSARQLRESGATISGVSENGTLATRPGPNATPEEFSAWASEWAKANPEGVQDLALNPAMLQGWALHAPYAKRAKLNADVARHGIRSPIPVKMRPVYDGKGKVSHYRPRMSDGHHRLAAALAAGLKTVPVRLYGPHAHHALDAHTEKDTLDGIANWR